MADTCVKFEFWSEVQAMAVLNFGIGDIVVITESDTLSDVPDAFPTSASVGLDATTDGVKFWYPTKAGATDSVQLPSQNYPKPYAMLDQVKREMVSGKVSIISRSEPRRTKIIPVSIKNVSTTKKVRLYKFLYNIADGAVNTFQFEDEGTNLYTVRYWEDSVRLSMESWLKHIVAIKLRKEVA